MADRGTVVDRKPMTTRAIATVAMLLVSGGACLWLAVRAPAGVAGSADPGAVAVPIWLGLIPVALALVLIRAIPPRLPNHPVQARNNAQLRRELVLLLGCAVAFPLLIGLWVGFLDVGYVLTKVVILILIPGTLLVLWRRRQGAATVTIQPPSRIGAWPLIPVTI